MPKQKATSNGARKPAKFITTLRMNRLKGRMLRLPPPVGKSREILLIYGHHSTIERWWGLVDDLSQYGGITVPDLPGFGGMESFCKIGEEPTIDNLADYLAAFVKLRYKRKHVTIVGLSFGFVVVTRMLQRYPDLARKVDLLVSVVGFSHHDDFTFSRPRHLFYTYGAKFFSKRVPSFLWRMVTTNPLIMRAAYSRTHNARHKFKAIKKEDFRKIMDFELHLWEANDARTHMSTLAEFLQINNCRQQVKLPVWHIATSNDNYFDKHIVEQHMRVIFTDFHSATARMNNHAPSIVADATEAAPFIPRKIRNLLAH